MIDRRPRDKPAGPGSRQYPQDLMASMITVLLAVCRVFLRAGVMVVHSIRGSMGIVFVHIGMLQTTLFHHGLDYRILRIHFVLRHALHCFALRLLR
jgi:hypothetical protein